MAHVHRLGHVGRAEIDHNGPAHRGGLEKQMAAVQRLLQRGSHRRGLESEVQKPRASHLDLLAPGLDLQVSQHLAGQLAWVKPTGFGQGHHASGLVIAKLRLRTGP